MKGIRCCSKCSKDCDYSPIPEGAVFCPKCGTKITTRSPEIHVDVEIEGQGSRCMSLSEFFGMARKKGLLK